MLTLLELPNGTGQIKQQITVPLYGQLNRSTSYKPDINITSISRPMPGLTIQYYQHP